MLSQCYKSKQATSATPRQINIDQSGGIDPPPPNSSAAAENAARPNVLVSENKSVTKSPMTKS